MSLPTYDKTKRRKSFEQLPKGAYVIEIKGAKLEKWPSGDQYVNIAFDIAEGEYKGIYSSQFENDSREDKKWPFDAVFKLNVPTDSSEPYVWNNWNTFFADLEDSNGGFVFSGDLKTLKGKKIGARFHNKQSEYNGNVYDHIVMKYTSTVEDVRSGKAAKFLPKDKLIGDVRRGSGAPAEDSNGFMTIADAVDDEELPF